MIYVMISRWKAAEAAFQAPRRELRKGFRIADQQVRFIHREELERELRGVSLSTMVFFDVFPSLREEALIRQRLHPKHGTIERMTWDLSEMSKTVGFTLFLFRTAREAVGFHQNMAVSTQKAEEIHDLLQDEGIVFGDPAYDWTIAGAKDLAYC